MGRGWGSEGRLYYLSLSPFISLPIPPLFSFLSTLRKHLYLRILLPERILDLCTYLLSINSNGSPWIQRQTKYLLGTKLKTYR